MNFINQIGEGIVIIQVVVFWVKIGAAWYSETWTSYHISTLSYALRPRLESSSQ
jgi:hypothetical protein